MSSNRLRLSALSSFAWFLGVALCVGIAFAISPGLVLAGTVVNTVSCIDTQTNLYHDTGLTMTGTSSMNPVDEGETFALQDGEWILVVPSEILVSAYNAYSGLFITVGFNSIMVDVDMTIQASETEEMFVQVSKSTPLTFTIFDPDGSAQTGDETAIVDPTVLVLPDSFWTAIQEDAIFSHGDVLITLPFPFFTEETVDCRSGTTDPGGNSFTPLPAPAFEAVTVVPAPVVLTGFTPNAVACMAVLSASGFPLDSTGSVDGGVSMEGTANPNLALPATAISLEDIRWAFDLPPEVALLAYANGPGVVQIGSNSFVADVSLSVDAPGTLESTILHVVNETLTFSIVDPNGTFDGDETAIVDPLIVMLPDSSWTTTDSDSAFRHGDLTLTVTFGIFEMVVDCSSGISHPDGSGFSPTTAPAFEIVRVPSPVSTPYTCTEDEVFGNSYAMSIAVGGLASPSPAFVGFPVDLGLVTLETAIPLQFAIELQEDGEIPLIGSTVLTIAVDQGITATNTNEFVQPLMGITSTTIALTQIVEGGEIELFLPDSVWTPTGRNVDFSQAALTLEITAASQTFTLECVPDSSPQPFETTTPTVQVPALRNWGVALLILALLLSSMKWRNFAAGSLRGG